ncbi:MAG: class I SAM-dependent methyltransferase [Omnitrophica WOR_2 bacterium]
MLPSYYHAHHALHMEDLPFWLELARQQGGPVLELGCGAGRLLLPMAQAGFLMYGLDRDAAMLAFLKSLLPPDLQPQPRLWLADMSAFCLAQHFPLIMLACNTLSTLSPKQRRACLEDVHRHLSMGGLFAVSIPNPAVLWELPAQGETEEEDVFYHPATGNPVVVSSQWERRDQLFIIRWHYDHLLPDGRVQRTSVEARQQLESIPAYLEEIRSAGLHPINQQGDYDGSPYTPRSPYWIVTAAPSSL